jgi:hypothetical protein
MNPVKSLSETKENAQEDMKELSVEELEQVNGAGNPFEDVPRVPVKPVDDKLRNKG